MILEGLWNFGGFWTPQTPPQYATDCEGLMGTALGIEMELFGVVLVPWYQDHTFHIFDSLKWWQFKNHKNVNLQSNIDSHKVLMQQHMLVAVCRHYVIPQVVWRPSGLIKKRCATSTFNITFSVSHKSIKYTWKVFWITPGVIQLYVQCVS